jgi:TRAP-type uncharacterized transport system substrate-binding protein
MRLFLSLTALLTACLLLAAPAARAETALTKARPIKGRAVQHPPTAVSEGEDGNVARVNNWTVGVAGGLLEGAIIKYAADLAKALDDSENLRILPMVTFGATDNVSDLLYLKGVDVAFTHADVLEEFRKNRKANNIEKRVNYISQVYISGVHVFARPEIKTFKDLEGKKVGFHTKGAGPTVTAPILFERMGVKVEPVHINNSIAYEQMKTGEIAAFVHLVSKPNDLFSKMKVEPGCHFLPIEYTDKFSDYYVPYEFTSEDYPNIIKPGERVETIAVPAVLAVYNWPKNSDRFRRVERFIEYYFSRFERLRQPPFQAQWKQVNLAAKVPGWTRYWVAEEMLNKLPALQAPFAPTSAVNNAPAAATASPDQKKLFKEFMDWKQQQKQH